MFFAWIFICRLHRGYKKVSTKISFSYQFTTILMDQLLCNAMLYIYISVLGKDRFFVYFVYGISSPTFSWIFICRLHRGYKKVSTKISFSYQFTTILMDQLLCNVMLYIYISVLVKDRLYVYFVYGISTPTFSWLAALNYFLLQQSPFSFLQCRSEMRKDLLFWQKFKFLYATPASLSRVVCLRLSKQSSVTARTNFSSQVLVYLPRKGFLLRSMFSAKSD